jgi:ATP-dependent DNA helicase RecQ
MGEHGEMKDILKQVFGFNDFRPHQETIIRHILDKHDVVAVMPTGGGKSLCYQLPSHILPGTVVVVSPLISLMKDQVDAARENDIAAAFLNSSLEPGEMAEVFARLKSGRLHLLYIAPERLANAAFLEALRNVSVSLFAIDEAHCISEWGHDFRPEYLNLGALRALFPATPLAAFTATATHRVQQDIVTKTGLRSPFILRASFDRPNLFYRAVSKNDVELQVLDFIRQHPGRPGIVYRTTRKAVVELAGFLAQNNISALPYHAGLDAAERTRNQEAFNKDEATVIVATIAFGMGIDKSNVRFVIHADLPKNIESYYQETGRAGRDNERADCLLLWSRGDVPKLKFFINKMEDDDERRIASAKLEDMVRYASSSLCRRKTLLAYFGETYPADACGHCDACTEPRPDTGLGSEARLFLSTVMRLGERYGVGLVVDFLTGKRTDRMRERNLDILPGFGAGRDEPAGRWRALVDDLIGRGLLLREGDPYPILKLGKDGALALANSGATRVLEREPRAAVSPSVLDEENWPVDETLFENLRALRRALASEHGVPPYVVFSDKTLKEMAARLPADETSLRAVSGVGEMKLANYGPAFLSVIKQYLAAHPEALPRRMAAGTGPIVRPAPGKPGKREKGDTIDLTRRMLEEGLSIAEIAMKRNLAASTIGGHLAELILRGAAIDLDDHVPREKRLLIQKTFLELRTQSLTPVVERLTGVVTYDDVRLVRAWLGRNEMNTE